MKLALLCPGPSVEKFPGPDGYARVVAVNRAAVRFPCDTWAAGDPPLVLKIRGEVMGGPDLFTTAGCAAQLRDHHGGWPGTVTEFESLRCVCDAALQWENFTATAALVYAAHVGATSIDVFGADWKGDADWDGQQAGMNRSHARWALEGRIWTNRLVPWLNQRGISITRHTD